MPVTARNPRVAWLAVAVMGGVLAVHAGAGCSKRYPTPELGAGGELHTAIAELRFRVASEPEDGRAHAALARLELRADRPGAALRHFERARAMDALLPDDRRSMAALYAQRFEARLAAGDGQALLDGQAAQALGKSMEPRDLAEARFLAALHAFRRGNAWGRADALGHLAEARRFAPHDRRLVAMAPEQAPLADLGHAALWLFHGNALRVAMDMLEMYVDRGGREPDVLRAFLEVRRWWGNVDGRRRIGLDLRRELMAAGVSLCPLAERADELGCQGTLGAVAQAEAHVAAAVREQARALGWHTAEPRDAAAWALLALRGWLAGEGGWETLLRQRVDVARVAGSAELPPSLRPTFLRMAGRAEAARQALEHALGLAPGQGVDQPIGQAIGARLAGLGAGERTLLMAEAALQGRDAAILDAIGQIDQAEARGAGQGLDVLAHERRLIAILHARSRGDAERVRTLVARAPGLEPWQARRLQITSLAHDHELVELSRIAAAYVRDPALCDRLAREFVDGAVYMGERAPMVAALFVSLGDPARARAWWERLVTLHPHHAQHELELGIAVARAGDPTRAEIHFTAAAVASGNAGATNLAAARALLESGHALAAITQARRALELTAPLQRDPILDLLARAMTQLGRHDEAAEMRARLRDPEAFQDHEAAEPATAPVSPSDVEGWLALVADESGLAAALEKVDTVLAWNPYDLRLHGALVRHLDPGHPSHVPVVREILAGLVTASADGSGSAHARQSASILQRAFARMDRRTLRRVVAVER